MRVTMVFDWLDEITLIGVMSDGLLRGMDNYGFGFDREWLSKYGGLCVSADLNKYIGHYYLVARLRVGD